MTIKVLLVDDHLVVLKGLRFFLQTQPHIVGSEMGIIESLPNETGIHLFQSAQNAFTLGMQVVYAITIVLVIVTAFFIIHPLRNSA